MSRRVAITPDAPDAASWRGTGPDPPYRRLIPSEPLSSLEDYIAAGGGHGLATALAMEPGEVIAEVTEAGLRGRGGAGFPTGTKWGSVRQAAEETASHPRLVVNGAEGEPGTYKDRLLLTMNPFAVLEGLIIAGYAIGVDRIVIGVKTKTDDAPRLREAIDELVAAGWEQADLVQVIEGPDEYLFGEETGLLEVIEGNQPLPRWLPPFQQGLFASTEQARPTAVNNVERSPTCSGSSPRAPIASGPSAPPSRPEPCCSPSSATWRPPASTSCRSVARYGPCWSTSPVRAISRPCSPGCPHR